jgi:hypothetical protein
MLSKNEIARYRRLGPEERYAIFLELAEYAWRALDADGEELGRRRWALIRRQHDESSARLEAKFRELARHDAAP